MHGTCGRTPLSIAQRRRAVLLAVPLAVAFGLGAGANVGEAAAALKGAFNGNAYGTSATAKVGPAAATLGRSAYLPCPCRGTSGETRTNTVERLAAGPDGEVLEADELRSTVRASKTATAAVVDNSSTVSGLRLLDGLITADAVKAVAGVSADAATVRTSLAGSTFVRLRVNGRAIAADIAPNTPLALPGVGSVVLKKVRRSGDGRSAGTILVEMLTIEVTRANRFGLRVGARLVVAHALAGFTREEPPTVVAGQAYAAQANAAIGQPLENQIGRAALVTMGCEGTGGRTVTNNIAALTVGRVLALGEGETTAFGGPDGGGTLARTTATVEGVRLLDGLITATVLKAVAEETFKDGRRTRSAAGSGFVGLKVAGVAVPITTAPNTRLALAGLGYVIVNEQVVPTGPGPRTLVNGLHVVITVRNPLNLPVGAELIVAHAEASAARF